MHQLHTESRQITQPASSHWPAPTGDAPPAGGGLVAACLRGCPQTFQASASHIKKQNTTTVTSLFFYIISANFNATILSFLQLLYSSRVEEFILLLKKVLHRLNDVTVTWKLCATQVFCQQWEQTQVWGCFLSCSFFLLAEWCCH